MTKQAQSSFLPQEYLRRKAESKALILNLVLFTVMIGGVGGAFVMTNRQWSEVRALEAQVDAEYQAEAAKIDQLKALDAKKQELMYRADVTNALIERVLRSVLLAEIVNRMPASSTITDFVMESARVVEPAPKAEPNSAPHSLAQKVGLAEANKAEPPRPKPPTLEFKLAIVGFAANDTDVADFQAALQTCTLLDRVDLISTVEHLNGEMALRKFRIEATIARNADTSTITPKVVERNAKAPAQAQTQTPAQPAPAGLKVSSSDATDGLLSFVPSILKKKSKAKAEPAQATVDPIDQAEPSDPSN